MRRRCLPGLLLAAWSLSGIAAAVADELRVSGSAERTASVPLHGGTVSGDIFVFASPSSPVSAISGVRFYLDDPGRTGSPRQIERNAPYDFAGGTSTEAFPFPTSSLPDGPHEITAAIDLVDGGTSTVSASFTVANQVPAAEPFALMWRSSSTATAATLDGAQVAGTVYVSLDTEAEVSGVRFYLDDPQMAGAPRQTENSAPWDFAGGTGTDPNPFDTRQVSDGPHTITAAVTQSDGNESIVHAAFVVANTVAEEPVPEEPEVPPGPGTNIAIAGDRFHINGSVTYPGAAAEGMLLNVRMVNSIFEDTHRSDFDPEANTDEFIAAMPSYVASGVRAFSISLQGGNPSYEGARNTALDSDGSLKQSYMDRAERVIRAADALGAVVILQIYYQRQDQHLANSAAVEAGVVNVCNWIAAESFPNLLLEIANEYPHGGFNHTVIRSHTGMVSLIELAKASCPSSVKVSTSGLGHGFVGAYANEPTVIAACDYLTIHFNSVAVGDYAAKIAALEHYGKPIVVNEDPKEGSSGARAAQESVEEGASWGYFRRANQSYPFSFLGSAEDPDVYGRLLDLATP